MSLFARHALAMSQVHGLSEEALIEGCDCPMGTLSSSHCALSSQQQLQVLKNLSRHLQIPGLGLRLGQRVATNECGPLYLCFLSAENSEKTQPLFRRLRTIMGLWLDYQREVEGDRAINRLHVNQPLGELRTLVVETALAIIEFSVRRLYNQEHIPLSLHLDYSDPGYGELYRQLFRCPVHFSQSRIELVYPAYPGGLPIASQDSRLHAAMLNLCDELALEMTDGLPLSQQVSALFGEGKLCPSQSQVALSLGMSERTLRQRLASEGTCFRQLEANHRRALAIRLLKTGRYTVQQVGEQCGFADVKSFFQAFKRWTGAPPSFYLPVKD